MRRITVIAAVLVVVLASAPTTEGQTTSSTPGNGGFEVGPVKSYRVDSSGKPIGGSVSSQPAPAPAPTPAPAPAVAVAVAQDRIAEEYPELLKKAEQGDVKAQSELGLYCMIGKGMPKNIPEAYKWLRKAADQGDPNAQCNLGAYYAGEDGAPKDDVEGAKWVRKAAEQGYPAGQEDLGERYMNGRGVPKDSVQAYMWLSLAAEKYPTPLAKVTRDRLAKTMTPQQIAEAQKLSRDWKTRKPIAGSGSAQPAPMPAPAPPDTSSSPGENSSSPKRKGPPVSEEFTEADQHFTYGGEPIHPGLLCEFLTSLADKGYPLTVAVDVAAAFHTNEYSTGAQKDPNGAVVIKNYHENSKDAYQWFGRLQDGSHVLHVWRDDGGRMFPSSLLFVTFSTGKGWKDDGTCYDRLLMTAIRRSVPFDFRSKVTVSDTEVVVSREGADTVIYKALETGQDAAAGPEMQARLAEVEKSFKYKGKPIHPGILEEFEGYMSDKGFPLSVSMDLAAAAGSNEYFDGDIKQRKPGIYVVEHGEGKGYFGYEWCGSMADGTQVVSTFSNGGGSGVFKTLYFLHCSVEKGFEENGTPYGRLLITATRWFPLGDRSDAKIQVSADKVVISQGADGNGPVTLDLAK